MSKVKSTKPQLYELLYIVPNNFTEEEAQKIHDKIKETIGQKGGEISFEEQWGKKKFVYPIKNFNHGYYNLVEFEIKRENVNDIDGFLKLSDEVLRHQIVNIKYPNVEKKKTAEKAAEKRQEEEEEKIREAQEKYEQEQKEDSQKEQEVKTEPKQEEQKQEQKEEAEKVEEKTEEVSNKEEAPSTSSTSSGQAGSEQEDSGQKEEEEDKTEKKEDEKEDSGDKKKKKSADLDDLDKKLDDILNTDDLV